MAKYVTIMKLAPGVENFRHAMGVFGRQGMNPGTEAIYAGADDKTFISIVERDGPDRANTVTYSPFFESESGLSTPDEVADRPTFKPRQICRGVLTTSTRNS